MKDSSGNLSFLPSASRLLLLRLELSFLAALVALLADSRARFFPTAPATAPNSEWELVLFDLEGVLRAKVARCSGVKLNRQDVL